MPRFVVGMVIGGVVGFFSHEASNFYIKRRNAQALLPCYDVQKRLASSWCDKYEPTPWNYNWDSREPLLSNGSKLVDENNNPVASTLPTATRHIFLIRHGQYNTKGNDDDHHSLTNLGIEQANSTGKRLAQLGLPYAKLTVSTMKRAKETADLIRKHLHPAIELSSTDLLREGAPFPPEPSLNHWKPDNKFLTDGQRIEAGFKELVHRASPDQSKDSYEIVVCHANVIRYIVCRALQLPPEAWLRMSLHNASITWLVIRPSGRVSIKMLGDLGSMTPKQMTTG